MLLMVGHNIQLIYLLSSIKVIIRGLHMQIVDFVFMYNIK